MIWLCVPLYLIVGVLLVAWLLWDGRQGKVPMGVPAQVVALLFWPILLPIALVIAVVSGLLRLARYIAGTE